MDKTGDTGDSKYRALARKWRPATFEELVGQEHITTTLKNSIRSGRIYSAYLFTGPRGVGKTSAARLLSKALNCDKGMTPEPCNRCRPCIEISEGRGVDVIEIDGASNNSVEDVRRIRDNVKYAPSYFRYKVYIIDEVHMLSIPAFNALLKTLEEPPPHVVFIFATTEPHKIPGTIEDRCQRFDFRRIPVKVMVDKLKEISIAEGINISEDSLLSISLQAEGSMRDAEALLDQLVSFAGKEIKDKDVVDILGLFDRNLLLKLLQGIIDRDVDSSIRVIRDIIHGGHDINIFLKEFLKSLRNLILIKVLKDVTPFLDITREEVERMKTLSDRTTIEEIERFFRIVASFYDSALKSEFPEVFLEMAVIKMIKVPPLAPIEDALIKLNKIQKRLSLLSLIPDGYKKEFIAMGDGDDSEPALEKNISRYNLHPASWEQTSILSTPHDSSKDGIGKERDEVVSNFPPLHSPTPLPRTHSKEEAIGVIGSKEDDDIKRDGRKREMDRTPLRDKSTGKRISDKEPDRSDDLLKGSSRVDIPVSTTNRKRPVRDESPTEIPTIEKRRKDRKMDVINEKERKKILDSPPLQLFQGFFECDVISVRYLKKEKETEKEKAGVTIQDGTDSE